MKNILFVDTNPFLYLLTKKEKKWERVTDVLDNDKYDLATSVIVINELKFKLLWMKASEQLGTNNKFEIINQIKENKKLRNEVYSVFLEFYIKIKQRFTIFEIKGEDELLSCNLSNEHGLLPSDSSILATMENNNIKKILTDDSDFKKIKSIEVIEI